MELLKVQSLKVAREHLLRVSQNKIFQVESVSLDMAYGRVLAEDIYAPFMVPDFRRSTVDGYAVIAADTWGADETTPVFLEMVEEIFMGRVPIKSIQSGQCAYVPTGGMLPQGADAVVMVEYSQPFGEQQIALNASVAGGNAVVEIGDDVKEGQLILKKSCLLKAADIATIAALGLGHICVYQKPKITILSTGDELVQVGKQKEKAQVYDVNSHGLKALALKNGFEIVESQIVADDEALLLEQVKKAKSTSDFIVVSGGSSQGKQDLTKDILDQVSRPGVFTHGLALKPGKPTILAYDAESATILVGLPGHPVAALLVFELLLIWYYRQRLGLAQEEAVEAVFESNLPAAEGRETCQLVELIVMEKQEGTEEDGQECIARPVLGASGLISTLSKATGYVLIDRNKEGLKAGERVHVYLL